MNHMVSSASSDVDMGRRTRTWTLFLLLVASLVQGFPSRKFNDLTEEAVIDNLESVLRGRQHPFRSERLKLVEATPRQAEAKTGKGNPFAIGPDDPRFFLAPSKDFYYYDMPEESPREPKYPSLDSRYPLVDLKDSDLGGSSYADYPDDYYDFDKRLGSLDEKYRKILDSYKKGLPQQNPVFVGDAPVRPQEEEPPEGLEGSRTPENPQKKTSTSEEVAEGAVLLPEKPGHLQRHSLHADVPRPRLRQNDSTNPMSDFYFTAFIAGCTVMTVTAVVAAGICWYRLHKNQQAAADADYPAYGITGPKKDVSPTSTERKLAQSAHMYHYQHQKQQMIALDKSSGGDRQGPASDVDSEEEVEEGAYTVYECPGLAPTGEMEVKNPLFLDDPTPATPANLCLKDEKEEEDDLDQ